jgi:alpha-galactosidase
MSDTEAIAHISIWAALKSPLLMTNLMKEIDAKTLSILQHPAILAVSQDPLGSAAVRRSREHVDDVNKFGKGEIQMFTGPLTGGDQLVLFLNAATSQRTMSATLEDVFWDSGPSGTADQIHQAWDVYDLWGSRLDDKTANEIIDGSIAPIGPDGFNITDLGGPKKVFSQTPPRTSKALMGTFVETVKAEGTVSAEVEPHGVAVLRLRAQGS